MKQKRDLISFVFTAVGATVLGILWLYRGLSGTGGIAVLKGVLFLLFAAVLAFLALLEFREKQQAPKAPPDEGP